MRGGVTVSINDRKHVQRHALVAACSSLDDMFKYQRFSWVKHPADVNYIVAAFRRYEGKKGIHYYLMPPAFVWACGRQTSVRAYFYDVVRRVLADILRQMGAVFVHSSACTHRGIGYIIQKLRHPFEYTRHA